MRLGKGGGAYSTRPLITCAFGVFLIDNDSYKRTPMASGLVMKYPVTFIADYIVETTLLTILHYIAQV